MVAIPIVWVLFAVATGFIAARKHKNVLAWFGLGLLLGPFAIIILLLTPKPEDRPDSTATQDRQP